MPSSDLAHINLLSYTLCSLFPDCWINTEDLAEDSVPLGDSRATDQNVSKYLNDLVKYLLLDSTIRLLLLTGASLTV